MERTFVTTTGNAIMDMLFNFHLSAVPKSTSCGLETMSETTGREVCAYLLVRGSVHAHAYALVLKKLTGVAIEKMLPVPNIDLSRIPESRSTWRKVGTAGSTGTAPPTTRRWPASGAPARHALPGDPPGELKVVDGVPNGGKIPDLHGMASAFTPEYAPEEMFDIAKKLYAASR